MKTTHIEQTPVWATPTPYPTSSAPAPFDFGDTSEMTTTFAEQGVSTWNMGNQGGYIDGIMAILILLMTIKMLQMLIKQVRDF